MKGAVFTIVKNEKYFLPVWLRYYSQFFAAKDIYVLDTGSDDDSVVEDGPYNLVNLNPVYSFDVQWLLDTVKNFQRSLLVDRKYDFVLFAEADEIVVPYNRKDFSAHIAAYPAVRCIGMEVLHINEPALDWGKPILPQRRMWTRNPEFDKPLLSKIPLDWEHGFHNASPPPLVDSRLTLIHLRRIDFETCRIRLNERRNWTRPPGQARNKAWQWMLAENNFAPWFMSMNHLATPIQEVYKNVV